MSLCQCGCGELTEIAVKTRTELGWVAGHPKPFLPKHKQRVGGLADRFDECWAETDTGCWEWQRALAVGYGYLRVFGVVVPAHRFSYERTYGAIPADHELHHRCENRKCVRPDHLEMVTRAEHRQRHSTHGPAVRALFAQGLPKRRIARELGIARSTVRTILLPR